MLFSMTGYGEATIENDWLRVGFRVRTVNNKGCDPHIKLPFEFLYLENELRALVMAKIRRGRVDVFSEIEIKDPEARPPTYLNKERLGELAALCEQMKKGFSVQGHLDVNTLIGMPEISQSQRVGYRLPESMKEAIQTALNQALDKVLESRSAEGAKLHADFHHRLVEIEREVLTLEERALARRDELREQIVQRVQKIAAEVTLDDHRLQQEIVYQADRLDITEEITRLKAHLSRMHQLLDSDKRPLGKQLDFMVQEQLREVTTTGNKARHKQIAVQVVKLKTEYEKIREQLQNVE